MTIPPQDATGSPPAEEDPILTGPDRSNATRTGLDNHAGVRWRLFVSHAIAAWNARMFEFGSVLFLSLIYPGTLLPVSVYAIARAFSAMLLSPAMGRIVDTMSRLAAIRISVVGQRLSVLIACLLFLHLSTSSSPASPANIEWLFLVLLAILACVEKLAAILNTIAVERDWVVVIASESESMLREMNSTMRRIDLTCKLVGPLIVALVASWSVSAAIIFTLGTALISVPAEYIWIAQVYRFCEPLQHRKLPPSLPSGSDSGQSSSTTWFDMVRSASSLARFAVHDVVYYTRHPAFLPSASLSLLYLGVLQFSGQMINYLISLGMASWTIGVLRMFAAGFEISATFLAPLMMARIGPVRSGIWLLNWQLTCLGIATAAMWTLDGYQIYLFVFLPAVMLSRAGLWGYDLSAQVIIQERVEDGGRGRFSAIESSVQNLFELLAYSTTIVFSRPEQFKIPAAISFGAVAVAACLYALYVRRERGHLFHKSRCLEIRKTTRSHVAYERLESTEG